MSDLSNRNSRVSTTEDCITANGLGYCCEWVFWARFQEVPDLLIAARLGVTDRTVRRHRKKFKEGAWKCCKQANCMKSKLGQE